MITTSLGLTFGSERYVIVKGCYQAPDDGTARAGEGMPLVADTYTGEAEVSAVRYESDFVPFKPRADVLCVGNAYPPGGRPDTECFVRLRVGPVDKSIHVIGDRQWEPALGGLSVRMSRPEPFTSVPVSYDRAFGGKDISKPGGHRIYRPNPVGHGYSKWGSKLPGLPLPNLEDPHDPIRSWRDRPRPMSFGPVGRTWEPRIDRAGTFNRRWLKHRAPELPEDFDSGYYNAAPDDQQIPGYLRGNEEVFVQNMHPTHSNFRCRLPGIRIRAFIDREAIHQLEEITMNLDTLWLDMEALQMVLVWRGQVPAPHPGDDAPVLIVEERLNDPPRPASSYRPLLEEYAAAEAEVDREADEADREIEAMDSAELTADKASPEERELARRAAAVG